MSAYWPPLENLPTFDVTVFRNAQDVVDFSIATETASKIALTSDNSSTTCYIPFSKTASATSNALYIDNVTTPLRYRPDTGEVSAQIVSIGGILNPASTANASILSQTGTGVFEIRNQETSGDIRLATRDATNAVANRLSLSSTDLTINTTNNPTITGFADPIASDSTNKIASTRWVQSAITAGSGTAASTVLVTDDNTATIYYPTFALTGTGQRSLFSDFTTTPLSYQPSTSTLTASIYGLRTTVASTISASGTTISLTNNNIGGTYNFTVSTSGIPLTILSLNETNSFYRVPFIVSAGGAPSATDSFRVTDSSSLKGVAMLTDSTVGSYNPIIVVNDSIIYGKGNVINTGNLTLTTWSATTAGVRITPTTVSIGAGGTAATPTAYTSYSAGTTTIAGTTINIAPNNFKVGTAGGAGGTCNIGYGASTTLSNVIITNSALAASVNYTTGQNTFIGQDVAGAVTSASANNTFVGYGAGNLATSGTQNVFVGVFAGAGNTTGTQNVFIGQQSGFQVTTAGTGSFNTCVGLGAGLAMTTTAGSNTFIGAGTASALTTGGNNTIIGINSGDNITTGSSNICIGNNSVVPVATNSNQIAIGTSAETQFIQGQFNWKVGPAITATLTLATPYAQFYTITSAATTTVTLQNPAAAYIGTHIMFKRKTNTQIITFTTVGGGLVITPFGSVALGTSVTMTAAQFQCELICDGVSWYQFNMT